MSACEASRLLTKYTQGLWPGLPIWLDPPWFP
jgi:hypothetical protein